ncbi:MAG: DinB family protein, partial [Acidimicrobiales bacterium]|nr:DinB family protein [Acidimicrobiales bacterium]
MSPPQAQGSVDAPLDQPAPVTAGDIVAVLETARTRTLAICDQHTEADQRAQHSPLMSPMVWDLAHIGNYEELWLLRELDGRAPVDPTLDDLYNAFEHPRWERPSLPILGPDEARAYDASVRAAVLDLLTTVDLDTPPTGSEDRRGRLLHQGFVYGMVAQHEHQHCETLLATVQLMGPNAVPPPGTTPAPRPAATAGTGAAPTDDATADLVRHDGGRVVIGTDEGWAYDNERPPHVVELAPYALGRDPV